MTVDPNGVDGVIVSSARGEVRATQSFVHVLSECWRRPGLTALEVLWRWMYGIPALWLLWRMGNRILQDTPIDLIALRTMTVTQPMKAAATLAEAAVALIPPVTSVAMWLAPLLLVTWVAWSSLGRTVVLRRMDSSLHVRPLTLMALQAMRMTVLAVILCLWLLCLQWVGQLTVTGPMGHGGEPNLVGYFALVILATILLFIVWATVSWGFSVAPLFAMLRNQGVMASLKGAFQLGPLKSKLIEINLVMGIVKIALVVLALVFSSTPLPFEGITTPEFLAAWWGLDGVLYLVASDFFHVARMLGYLRLWQAYDGRGRAA